MVFFKGTDSDRVFRGSSIDYTKKLQLPSSKNRASTYYCRMKTTGIM